MEEDKEIINRLVEFRKGKRLTQIKFGESLGITGSAITQMESGQTKINEKHIKLISGVYGINEEWLRSGEGTMYKDGKAPDEDIMLKMFRELSPEGQKLVLDYINYVLKNEKKLRGEIEGD